ncbi:hypothetical protein BDQ12DRAFT_727391 [Crucibulum laeve]|uniref:BHLH domain-containing protein n=1 Tax=Crucibulum laeve TaxID=68775 RepID=A0A5C3LL98_9AGAR|nr:hypothetical protein BDQ12DRAFT_727391 [Crucibulum laeve]
MAMTLPIQLPTTPSSEAANGAPATPVSPAASLDNSTSPSSANNNSVSSTTNANSTNNTNSNNANNTTANANTNSVATANAAAQMKRKPSRRANTAERRATHNAVERQRRETLNGRFLDLAALLPNLSQIRRPSKSSIVNSSIAHIHASRRHRLLASRELRLIKLEADALRRELNEWRDRAGIPRVDEPVRGEGFSMVLGGELELIAPIAEEGDEDEDGGDGEGEVHAGVGGGYGYVGGAGDEDMDDYSSVPPLSAGGMHQHPGAAAMMGIAEDEVMKNPFAHNPPSQQQQHQQQGGQVHLTHILPRPGTGGMMSPVYDGPLGMYDHHPNHPSSHHGNHPSHHAHGGHNGHPMMHHQGNQYPPSSYPHPHPSHPTHPSHPNHPSAHHGHGPHHSMSHQQQMEAEKMAAYAAHVYGSNNNAQQAQRSLFTPPATSHGLPSAANGPNSAAANGAGNGTGSSTGSGPNSPAHSSGSPIQAGFPVPSDQFFAYQQQQAAQRAGYASSPSDDGSHQSHHSIPLSHPSHPNNHHGAHPIPMKRGAGGGRDRAGSLALSVGSAGSFGGSPVGSPSYELSHGEYMGVGVPRRGGGAAAGWVGGGAGREEMMMSGGNGGMVAVGGGGGGSGGGFAMMM